MLLDFIIPFFTILLAEFGDKTQLVVLNLSTKTKNYLSLFFGVMFAFLLIDGFAVFLGNYIINLVDMFWIKLISASLFIIFGILGFIYTEDKNSKVRYISLRYPFFVGFYMIFLAEIGDKSQIVSALFGSIYNPFLVLFGVILALSILSLIAIVLGKLLFKFLSKKKIDFLSNILFILIGVFTLINLFYI